MLFLPQRQSFPNLGRRHVVQKDDIDAVNLDKSARLLQIISLHFDADVWSLLAKLANLIGKTGKPSERGQMIVLYEHHVVQAKTMINATACDHCSLFQCAQPGRGFACIQDLGRMVSNGINKLARKRCDAAETLQKIQRDAFRFQNRTRQAAHFDNDIAGNNVVAICGE